MAGLPEDLDSAKVIEERWKKDGLEVTKPRYKVLLSYPDDNIPNRLIHQNNFFFIHFLFINIQSHSHKKRRNCHH
jgi:hypothetical protein